MDEQVFDEVGVCQDHIPRGASALISDFMLRKSIADVGGWLEKREIYNLWTVGSTSNLQLKNLLPSELESFEAHASCLQIPTVLNVHSSTEELTWS